MAETVPCFPITLILQYSCKEKGKLVNFSITYDFCNHKKALSSVSSIDIVDLILPHDFAWNSRVFEFKPGGTV